MECARSGGEIHADVNVGGKGKRKGCVFGRSQKHFFDIFLLCGAKFEAVEMIRDRLLSLFIKQGSS